MVPQWCMSPDTSKHSIFWGIWGLNQKSSASWILCGKNIGHFQNIGVRTVASSKSLGTCAAVWKCWAWQKHMWGRGTAEVIPWCWVARKNYHLLPPQHDSQWCWSWQQKWLIPAKSNCLKKMCLKRKPGFRSQEIQHSIYKLRGLVTFWLGRQQAHSASESSKVFNRCLPWVLCIYSLLVDWLTTHVIVELQTTNITQ